MKKSLLSVVFTALFFVSFIGQFSVAKAQSTEVGDVVFTPYYPKPWCTKCMPALSMESQSPENRPTFVASPNPSYDGIVKVWYDKLAGTSELVIVDATGKQFLHTTLGSDRSVQGSQTLDVSAFAGGLYFFILKSGAYQAVQKVIIR